MLIKLKLYYAVEFSLLLINESSEIEFCCCSFFFLLTIHDLSILPTNWLTFPLKRKHEWFVFHTCHTSKVESYDTDETFVVSTD